LWSSSPSYHGYDVTDYHDVNRDYGSLADLRKLVEAAHARGMA
jgi:glycosidase